ncbi:uncharacterized protein METZ01_LOCUS232090, partial [marine metagenome]
KFFRCLIILYGVGFLTIGLGWDLLTAYSSGIGFYQWILIITGIITVGLGMLLRRRFLFPVCSIVTCYLIIETTATFLYVYEYIQKNHYYYVMESSDDPIVFDPVIGYRLPHTPFRVARKTLGILEYVGLYRGNNLGFPDRDDFTAVKSTPDVKRFVIFGDSFTAGQFFKKNWPDTVEDSTRENVPVQLLNFSVDGGGIANWWSALVQIIDKDNYEIDGIIFAVAGGEFDHRWNDLRRNFFMIDHRNTDVHLFGAVDSWEPKLWPKTIDEARPYLHAYQGSQFISTEAFDRFVEGNYEPLEVRLIRPYFALKIWEQLNSILNPEKQQELPITPVSVEEPDLIEPGTMPLIEDIKEYIDSHNLPSLVVHIPSRMTLLGPPPDYTIPASVAHFANLLNADLVNGAVVFQQLDATELKDRYFPYDGHWNQQGSDEFAEYFGEYLQQWP